MSVITFIDIIGRFLVAKLLIFCETTKKNGKIFGGLTEKRYFCHQKTLKLSKIMIDVKETLKKSEERMEMAAMFLEEELNRVRAGRANVAILDGVRVELYGSKVPLNQVANVSVPDPRTIAIKPWDRKEIRNIEKAIMDSDVGITPENNGEIIRLNIPVPTEERRRDLVKQCNKICEKAKVEVRNVRGDVKDKLKKAIKDGLSEDNEKDAELELQKLHDKYIKKLDDLMAAKNKEIMTV
jgi:ribosome recycling factor